MSLEQSMERPEVEVVMTSVLQVIDRCSELVSRQKFEGYVDFFENLVDIHVVFD